MKDALHTYGDRAALIKYGLDLEDQLELAKRDLQEVEARLINLQKDLTAQLAHKIKQVNNKPTPLRLVEKPLVDRAKKPIITLPQIEAAARVICLHYHGNQNNTTAEYNTLTIGWEKFTDQVEEALKAAGDVS